MNSKNKRALHKASAPMAARAPIVAVPAHAASQTPDAPTPAGESQGAAGSIFNEKEKAEIKEIAIRISKEVASEIQKDMDQKLTDREVRVMEVLAVFVVVLTFVSTNISIFSRISSLSTAVFFMVAMTVCLIAFLAVLFSILYRDKPDKIKGNPFLSWTAIWFPIIATLIIITILVHYPKLNVRLNPPCPTSQQCS